MVYYYTAVYWHGLASVYEGITMNIFAKSRSSIIFLAAALMAMGMDVMATSGNVQFASLESTIVGWAQGSLGVVIAVSALLVGLAIGIAKQSLMAVVSGLGIAIALYYGPTVIMAIMGAAGAVTSALPAAATVGLF